MSYVAQGSIIFACHKVGNTPSTKNGNSYMANSAPQYYDDSTYNLPPLNVQPDYHSSTYNSQHTTPQYSSQNWSTNSEGTQTSFSQWSQSHNTVASSPSVSLTLFSLSTLRVVLAQHQHQQHQWSSQPPTAAYMEPNGSGGLAFSGGVTYSGTPTSGTPAPDNTPAGSEEAVPAARPSNRRASTKDGYGSGSRAAGNPPVGIMKCSSCKVTHSPEWRKGPSGKKDLCNA